MDVLHGTLQSRFFIWNYPFPGGLNATKGGLWRSFENCAINSFQISIWSSGRLFCKINVDFQSVYRDPKDLGSLPQQGGFQGFRGPSPGIWGQNIEILTPPKTPLLGPPVEAGILSCTLCSKRTTMHFAICNRIWNKDSACRTSARPNPSGTIK